MDLEATKVFFRENKDRPEVSELPSGLQYEMLQKGYGKQPTEAHKAKCHYRGSLIDGTTFINTFDLKEPRLLPVRKLFEGLKEGIQLMRVGSKFRFYIPPHLSWREKTVNNNVPPNSALIFELELLDVILVSRRSSDY